MKLPDMGNMGSDELAAAALVNLGSASDKLTRLGANFPVQTPVKRKYALAEIIDHLRRAERFNEGVIEKMGMEGGNPPTPT